MLLQIAEPEGFGQKGKRKKDAKTAAGQKLPAKRPAAGDPAQRNAAITNFFKSADGVPACLSRINHGSQCLVLSVCQRPTCQALFKLDTSAIPRYPGAANGVLACLPELWVEPAWPHAVPWAPPACPAADPLQYR